MLPDPERQPSGLVKSLICVDVAFDIAANFLEPVVAVCLGYTAVFGASMPKTTIDEHSYPGGSKHQICAPVEARNRPCVYSITKALAVNP
jgi:hypothetical protein